MFATLSGQNIQLGSSLDQPLSDRVQPQSVVLQLLNKQTQQGQPTAATITNKPPMSSLKLRTSHLKMRRNIDDLVSPTNVIS